MRPKILSTCMYNGIMQFCKPMDDQANNWRDHVHSLLILFDKFGLKIYFKSIIESKISLINDSEFLDRFRTLGLTWFMDGPQGSVFSSVLASYPESILNNYFKQFLKCLHSCYERILINGWLLWEISIAKHWMFWGWWKSSTELLWGGKVNYYLPVKEDYLHDLGSYPRTARWQLGLRGIAWENQAVMETSMSWFSKFFR